MASPTPAMMTQGGASMLRGIGNALQSWNEAEMFGIQADMYDFNADMTRIMATKYAERVRSQTEDLVASQSSSYAASGVALVGSVQDVAMDTERRAEEQIAINNIQSEISAISNEVQASMARSKRRTSRFMAGLSLASGGASATSSIMGG